MVKSLELVRHLTQPWRAAGSSESNEWIESISAYTWHMYQEIGNRTALLTWRSYFATSMADQATAKKTLSQLSKREDLNNKICCDCSNPNPQWASLRYHNINLTKVTANHRIVSLSLYVCNVLGYIAALVYTSGQLIFDHIMCGVFLNMSYSI